MSWLTDLFKQPTVAGTLIVLGVVIATGLALGAIKVKKVGLGVAGVLFSGLLAGHLTERLGLRVGTEVLNFLREAGLVLFVFAIGLQIGPGFAASLRRGGIALNACAAAGIVVGTVLAGVLGTVMGLSPGAIAGILAGATTNTPSLAAGQSLLTDRIGAGDAALATAGYALAYPMGIIGTIAAMLVVRIGLAAQTTSGPSNGVATEGPRVARLNIEITNPNLEGIEIRRLRILSESGVIVTRRLNAGRVEVPGPSATLRLGDVILLVGALERLEEAALLMGRRSTVDLHSIPSAISSKRMVVTRREVLGRSIASLDLTSRFGVTISRVSRAGVELAPGADYRINFADSVLAVGPEEGLREVALLLGDSARTLEHSHLIPVFAGIALGVALGSVPLTVPGLPGTVKLGLAGGPLMVAILLSRLGRVGPVVCYLPLSANFALREIGIALFLGCVGMVSAGAFFEAAMSSRGLEWFMIGAAVTLLPLLVVAGLGRWVLRADQPTLFGLLAGSMTDPPALAFANALTKSEAPGLSYSTVYPLAMLARIVCIQVLVLALT